MPSPLAAAERPTVLVTEPIAESALALLGDAAEPVVGPAIDADAWARARGIVVRTNRITAADMAKAPGLKVIGKHGSGVDNIDLDAARARGIRVTNTPEANLNAVAELTLGLAIALARRILPNDRSLRDGHPSSAADRQGIELTGRRLGIAGFGRIGRRVARLFQGAFGMTVTTFDPYARDVPETVTLVPRLADLLPVADVLTVHTPLTPETRGLIGAAELAALPRGALVINAARGGVVDEAALAAALAGGHLAGAAADAFEVEPPPASHPLLALPTFIGTPHIGAMTDDAMARMGREAVEGVLDVLAGRPPRYPVL